MCDFNRQKPLSEAQNAKFGPVGLRSSTTRTQKDTKKNRGEARRAPGGARSIGYQPRANFGELRPGCVPPIILHKPWTGDNFPEKAVTVRRRHEQLLSA